MPRSWRLASKPTLSDGSVASTSVASLAELVGKCACLCVVAGFAGDPRGAGLSPGCGRYV